MTYLGGTKSHHASGNPAILLAHRLQQKMVVRGPSDLRLGISEEWDRNEGFHPMLGLYPNHVNPGSLWGAANVAKKQA